MQLWRTLAELPGHLADLFGSYLSYGFLFFVLHVFVAALILLQTYYYRIRSEIRALRSWDPERLVGSAGRSDAKTTRHLDQFVGECTVLGQRGFCVPMTDCSDRLDSIVDGLVGELHDRSNLFVIIGVAGTLYGLAEYALFGQVSSKPGDEVQRLTEAMGKAFPVGFVGLILTLGFQVWAARPEGRLRVGLAEATGKALRFRRDHLESQTGAIREVVKDLAESLGPLRDFGGTLRQEMEALAGLLGTQFDRSLISIREQVELFSESGRILRDGVTSLSTGVATVVAVSGRLDETLKAAPRLLEGLAGTQAKLDAVAAAAEERNRREEMLVAEVAQALSSAASSIAGLSERVENLARASLEATRTDAARTWREGTERFVRSAEQEYASFLQTLVAESRPLRVELQKAVEAWMDVAKDALELLRRPLLETFNEARKELRADLREFLRVGTEVLPDLAERVENLRRQTASTVIALGDVHEKLETWLSSVQAAEGHTRGMATVLSQALTRMQETLTTLSSKPLEGIAERLLAFQSESRRNHESQIRILTELEHLAKVLRGSDSKPRKGDLVPTLRIWFTPVDNLLRKEILKTPKKESPSR